MKIAITSSGSTVNDILDERFGRCAYFAIHDTVNQATEFIQNPHATADSGAGPATVQFIAEKGVSKIISGEFGFKIKPLLDSLKIQMIVIKEPDKKINDIIKMLNL